MKLKVKLVRLIILAVSDSAHIFFGLSKFGENIFLLPLPSVTLPILEPVHPLVLELESDTDQFLYEDKQTFPPI